MKKRLWLVLLCGLLLVQTARPMAAEAAGTVYFVAAEENVLPISDSTMPFWSGGYLYISTSIFTGTTREILGISAINNTAKGMTVLEKDRRAILFDWSKDYAQEDNTGNIYQPGAIQRNGGVFVPAIVVADFFGLKYSVTEVNHGYLVWLRSPDFSLSEHAFVDAASYQMVSRYEQYLRAQESTGEEESVLPDPDVTGSRRIYLCLKAQDETAGSLLSVLENSGAQAAFFCTPQFMEQQGELLRRMSATGQSIGILVDGTEAEETVGQQIQRANQALQTATFGKTRLVYIQNGTEAQRQAAAAEGWCCLRPDLDRSGYSLRSASNAEALLQRISSQWGTSVSVWLGDTATGGGLRALIQDAERTGRRCLALREI